MPDTEVVDYRQTPNRDLLEALARHEPLALAEVYHRSAAAAHAVAVRLLGTARDAESLLREVYADLWRDPPAGAPLEAWVRYRTFSRGRDWLRDSGGTAASPSTALLLGETEIRTPQDRAEQAIAALDDKALRALLLAHDCGTPTADQRAPQAGADLHRALLALAEANDTATCDQQHMADYVLGLLDDAESDEVVAAISASADCAELARALRRGRRRIEGLPPAPDVGQRIIAHVLTTGGAVATIASAPASDATDDAFREDPTTGALPSPADSVGAAEEPTSTRPDAPPPAARAEPTLEEPLPGVEAQAPESGAPADVARATYETEGDAARPGGNTAESGMDAAEPEIAAESGMDAAEPEIAAEPGGATPGQEADPAWAEVDASRPGDPSDATAAAAGASVAGETDESAPESALDDLVGGNPPRGRQEDDVRLSDLLDDSEDADAAVQPGGAGERTAASDAPSRPEDHLDRGAPAGPVTARDPIRIGGARSEPPAPAAPAAPADTDEGERPAWGQSAADHGEIRFDSMEEADQASRGRRVGTVLLTILGALLLLAAGGVAGLLLIRVVLG